MEYEFGDKLEVEVLGETQHLQFIGYGSFSTVFKFLSKKEVLIFSKYCPVKKALCDLDDYYLPEIEFLGKEKGYQLFKMPLYKRLDMYETPDAYNMASSIMRMLEEADLREDVFQVLMESSLPYACKYAINILHNKMLEIRGDWDFSLTNFCVDYRGELIMNDIIYSPMALELKQKKTNYQAVKELLFHDYNFRRYKAPSVSRVLREKVGKGICNKVDKKIPKR